MYAILINFFGKLNFIFIKKKENIYDLYTLNTIKKSSKYKK